MNFVADESVDQPIITRLRGDGHQIWSVAEMEPGISDDVVLDLANRLGVVLLTADKDFGELVFRQGRLSTGVVLARLAGLAPAQKADIVAAAIRRYGPDMNRAFSIVTASSVRVRRLD